MSVFGHHQTPPRPSQDTLRPFPIEVTMNLSDLASNVLSSSSPDLSDPRGRDPGRVRRSDQEETWNTSMKQLLMTFRRMTSASSMKSTSPTSAALGWVGILRRSEGRERLMRCLFITRESPQDLVSTEVSVLGGLKDSPADVLDLSGFGMIQNLMQISSTAAPHNQGTSRASRATPTTTTTSSTIPRPAPDLNLPPGGTPHRRSNNKPGRR